MKKLIIINGPNLNLIGQREPEVYGYKNFDTFFRQMQSEFPKVEISYFQSNLEGEIIDKLQEVGFNYYGIILNAGGYTHTSVSIADAITAIDTPVVEVHISNIFSRESFRHVSLLGANCKGSISGFGLESYRLAIKSFIDS